MRNTFFAGLILFSFNIAFAQETQIISNPNHLFEDAKTLFTQQKYGVAKKMFEDYLLKTNENSGFYADASYYLACSAYELNDPNSEEIFKNFVAKYPYYPMQDRISFLLAKIYFEDKKYKQSTNYLLEITPSVLNKKEEEEYYFMNGFCLLQQKEYERARINFTRINYSDSYTDDKNYYVAYCDYCFGKYDEALIGFEKCKASKYEEPALFHILQIYEQLENSPKAIEIGKQLIKNYPDNPNNYEAYRILGESSYNEKNYDEAIYYLKSYENIAKKVQREDMFMLGISLYKKMQYSDAVKYLSKVTAKQDEMATNAYFTIGQCALKTNDMQKAKMSFYSAYSGSSNGKMKEESLYNYAIATYQTGSVFGETTKAFNKFITEYPSSNHYDEILDLLASAYMNESNYDEALKSINSIKKPNAKIIQAKEYILFQIGAKNFNEKSYNKAIDYLSKSIDINNNSSTTTQAYLFRGESYFRAKEYDKSRNDLKIFISKNKNIGDSQVSKAFYTIGYGYFTQEQWDNAQNWFSQYLSKEPDKQSEYYFDALSRIGDCYFYKRNFTDATTYYSKVIASNSTNTDYAIYQKAFIKGLQKNYSGEIADMQKVIRQYPNSVYAPKAQYEIGRAYVLQNRYNDAIEQYNVVLNKYPQNHISKKASLEIGMLYENMGQDNKAIEAYKHVVENYPGSEQTNVALESMQNLYVEKNDVNSYIKYVNSLGVGTAIGVTASKEDSLSFIAAEKVYAKKEYKKAIVSLNNYTNKFCQNNNTLNCINAKYYLAESYYEEENMPMALEKYKELAMLDGNEYQELSLIRSADIAYREKQFDLAATFFKKLKETTTKSDTKFKSQLGMLRCNYQTNNYTSVVDNATILLNSPTTPEVEKEARYSRMKALVALKDWDNALNDIEFLKNDLTSSIGAEATFLMAEYYFHKNRLQQSEDEIISFINKKSPYQYWIARSFILLSDIYFAQKDYFQAKQYLITLKDNYTVKDDIQPMTNSRLTAIDAIYKEDVY